jgi:hypothetical protein
VGGCQGIQDLRVCNNQRRKGSQQEAASSDCITQS